MLHINWGNNKDVDLKCCLSSKLSTARPGQSKNLYYSKRDVSVTVDMTSSRFFGMWGNCYIVTIQLIEFLKIKPCE